MLCRRDKVAVGLLAAYGFLVVSLVLLCIHKSYDGIVEQIVDEVREYADQEPVVIDSLYYYDESDPLWSVVPYRSEADGEVYHVTEIGVRGSLIIGNTGEIILSVKGECFIGGEVLYPHGPLYITIGYVDGAWEIIYSELPL